MEDILKNVVKLTKLVNDLPVNASLNLNLKDKKNKLLDTGFESSDNKTVMKM